MGIINSNLTKLGSFLGNEKLYIPEYQRGYSWEETQLDDFWIDLLQIYEENIRDEHFFGQVVIHKNKEDGKRYIIDGQQRISTTIILLDILRTKFKEIADSTNNNDANDDSEDINAKYIGRISESKREQYLSLGSVDKDFFFKYIQTRGPIDYTDKKFGEKKIGRKCLFKRYDRYVINLYKPQILHTRSLLIYLFSRNLFHSII